MNVFIESNVQKMMDKYNAGQTVEAHEFAFMLGLMCGLLSEYEKLRIELSRIKRELEVKEIEAQKRIDEISPDFPETSADKTHDEGN